MAKSILVSKPSDLTVAWAQQIVDLHAPNITVLAINIISIDVGTTTRVRVVVEHNGTGGFPHRWFVKLPSLSWRAWLITALPRLLWMEVCFYKDIVHLVPVARPTILAAQSKFGHGAILVLADMTEIGAVPGLPSDTLTPTQATLVVEQLAQLHARFWNQETLEQEYNWLANPLRRWEDCLGTVLAVPLMKRGLRYAADTIPTKLHKPAIRYAHKRCEAMRFLSEEPRTLVHHDCHPGNIFWNQSHPGLLDWQLVRLGEGIGDVAFFLATALEPENRRTHEMTLLEHYRQVLANYGVGILDFTNLLERYRAHLIYPFEAMVVTLAIGGMMEEKTNLELIRRAAAAIEDFDVFSIYATM